MDSRDVIARLRTYEPDLRRLGVAGLYLFGSAARGEAQQGSDIDLFFDHRRGEISLFALMDIKNLARRILGRPTDIMTRSSLHPTLRAAIEATAMQVF